MPRPLLRHLEALIEELGGEEYIFDLIILGTPIREIAKLFINPKTQKPYNTGTLYHWRNLGGEERKRKWSEAIKLAFHGMVEEAGDILDDAAKDPFLTSPRATIARERAKHRLWRAGKANREDYGETPAQQTFLTVENLHLQALQAEGTAGQISAETDSDTPTLLAEPVEAEFEVLDEGTEAVDEFPTVEDDAGDDISELLEPTPVLLSTSLA